MHEGEEKEKNAFQYATFMLITGGGGGLCIGVAYRIKTSKTSCR